ncbi:hypothetical protein [Paenibacillus lutimineralis]|uniref:2TM domain-containing protein n=1 Tax=Paenibacillus lutimineralis TaxID=2707005 RepID=A0A3Q9ID70_9BACL|nr:hypothetical protein [Paenibacillus lutimineralis]AZS16517.1 hypothetical protein EI981_20045 [Paenibacillus lutimineralis]
MKVVKKKSKWKHAVYLILALAMLVYAIPLIKFQPGGDFVSWFGMVWAAFALLVIGAHLHFLLGVNEEKQRALDAVRRAKLSEWQSKWSTTERQNHSM